MEVPAPFAGTITALAAEPGTKVKVGAGRPHATSRSGEWRRRAGAGERRASRRVERREPSRPTARRTARAAGGNGPRSPNGHASPGQLPPAAPSVRHARPQARHRPGPRPRQRARRPHPARRPHAVLTPKAAPADTRAATPGTDTAEARLRHRRHARQARRPAPEDRRAHGRGEAARSRTTPTSTSATSPTWSASGTQLREPLAKAGVKLTYLRSSSRPWPGR